jgi:hypothetical protein
MYQIPSDLLWAVLDFVGPRSAAALSVSCRSMAKLKTHPRYSRMMDRVLAENLRQNAEDRRAYPTRHRANFARLPAMPCDSAILAEYGLTSRPASRPTSRPAILQLPIDLTWCVLDFAGLQGAEAFAGTCRDSRVRKNDPRFRRIAEREPRPKPRPKPRLKPRPEQGWPGGLFGWISNDSPQDQLLIAQPRLRDRFGMAIERAQARLMPNRGARPNRRHNASR